MDNKNNNEKNQRTRSRSKSKEKIEKVQKQQDKSDSDEEIQKEILKNFGFLQFGSSKGKDHTASSAQGFFKAKNEKRDYRQYMHRRGGFNRLLDHMD